MPKSKTSKTDKSANKIDGKNLIPVFRLKPTDETRCICKWLGNINVEEKLADSAIEFEGSNLDKSKISNKYTYFIGTYGSYSLMAKACTCNISASYILKNTKLPVSYVTFLYDKRFVSGQLFTMFIYFTFDEDTQKGLDAPVKYVNKLMSGKYTVEFVSDDNFLTHVLDKKRPEIENLLFAEHVNNFDNSTDDEKNKLFAQVAQQTEEKLDGYRKFFQIIEIKKPKNSILFDHMNNIINSPLFDDLVNVGLEMREKERKEKSCPDQDYKIPKRVINLKEIKDNPDKIDELLDNMSDVSSDDDN